MSDFIKAADRLALPIGESICTLGESRPVTVGGCDVAETCEGTSSLCPDDPGTAGKTCPAQIAALVDLYDSTGGVQWIVSTNWKSGDPCSPSAGWIGVLCSTNLADGSFDVK